jgi:hypothetical protein
VNWKNIQFDSGMRAKNRFTCHGNSSFDMLIQGSHGTGKTGKMVKKNSLHGKFREFDFCHKFRENSGNFVIRRNTDSMIHICINT